MDEQVDSRGRRRALVVAASATAAVAVVVALVLLAARDASPGAADPGGTVLPTVAGTGTAARMASRTAAVVRPLIVASTLGSRRCASTEWVCSWMSSGTT